MLPGRVIKTARRRGGDMQIVYERGRKRVEALQQAVDDFRAELRSEAGLRDQAKQLGLDPDALAADGAIVVRPEVKAGFDPTVLGVIIGLGSHIARSAWDDLALEWLRDRLGIDALGAERERREE
jgi:hypothetical protein